MELCCPSNSLVPPFFPVPVIMLLLPIAFNISPTLAIFASTTSVFPSFKPLLLELHLYLQQLFPSSSLKAIPLVPFRFYYYSSFNSSSSSSFSSCSSSSVDILLYLLPFLLINLSSFPFPFPLHRRISSTCAPPPPAKIPSVYTHLFLHLTLDPHIYIPN